MLRRSLEYAGVCKNSQEYAQIIMQEYAEVCIQNKGPKALLRNARVTMLRSTTIWSRGLKYTRLGLCNALSNGYIPYYSHVLKLSHPKEG